MIAIWAMLALIASGVLIFLISAFDVLRAALSLKAHVSESASSPLFDQLERGSRNFQRLSASLQTMSEQFARIKAALEQIASARENEALREITRDARSVKVAFTELIATLR